MSKFNKDVLFLILVELQNDRKSLYSCLLINRTWCETTVPILWKNPLKFCPTHNKRKLFNVILLHLTEESRENQEIDLFTKLHQRPLFNYISFWRYLNLSFLESMITSVTSKTSIMRSEILKLLINENTKFTHVYLNTPLLNYQLHLISGAEHCFSEINFLLLNNFDCKNQNVLEGFARISKSIKRMEFHAMSTNISGIIKLIEAQKNLIDVQFHISYLSGELAYKALEESLIKHADTIQHLQIYWKPITKILSHLINLLSFDINVNIPFVNLKKLDLSHLEVASLPDLRILKAREIPSRSLASLIENTKGHLTEISVYLDGDCEKFIQAICQNCPKLMYIKLWLVNSNISGLEKLLTNCQCLNGLVILTHANYLLQEQFDWDNLFKVLTKSSPDCLFKFKFWFDKYQKPRSESLRLLFESWKGRHPMLLQILPMDYLLSVDDYFGLIEKYKIEGVIKNYDNDFWGHDFEDFEWIQRNF